MEPNWTVVLIGNLFMDSAIAIFAILSGIEAYYMRLDEERSTHYFRYKAKKVSPAKGIKIVLIGFMFLLGVILQIIGIYYDILCG